MARALMRYPRILLLDEATSSLDSETESTIVKRIEEFIKKQKLTLIIISHRLSTIKNCDDIIVIKGGKLVEQGKHNDMVSNDGYYKTLFDQQIDK